MRLLDEHEQRVEALRRALSEAQADRYLDAACRLRRAGPTAG